MREKRTFRSVTWERNTQQNKKPASQKHGGSRKCVTVINWRLYRAGSIPQYWKSSCSCLALLSSSLTYLFLGRLRGLSYGAGHVCSWGWRPRNANPPPQLRKVPCLPVQNENNKEPSVAAASGVQCTHQNMSKRHRLLPPTHLPMHDSPSLPCFLSLTLFSTYERHVRLQTTV